ncbi:MAG: hypothetical protein VST68_06185, partial [Nitrospirota bacterium]|nr:hypothetical protein [Nitrospirota bacterium]
KAFFKFTTTVNTQKRMRKEERGLFKKHALAEAGGPLFHPPKPKGAKTPLFHGQGLCCFGARSVQVSTRAGTSRRATSL